jgi:hypothetical protein
MNVKEMNDWSCGVSQSRGCVVAARTIEQASVETTGGRNGEIRANINEKGTVKDTGGFAEMTRERQHRMEIDCC